MKKELYQKLHNEPIDGFIDGKKGDWGIRDEISNFDLVYQSGRTYSTHFSCANHIEDWVGDPMLNNMSYSPVIPWIVIRGITDIPDFNFWTIPPQVAEAIINFDEWHRPTVGIDSAAAEELEKREMGNSSLAYFSEHVWEKGEIKIVIETNANTSGRLGGDKWVVKFFVKGVFVAMATSIMFHSISKRETL